MAGKCINGEDVPLLIAEFIRAMGIKKKKKKKNRQIE